ncbi:DNA internalization-related competence protein ComEC/Rec2 [Candidatus Magnetaquicoccus inordinatus]|uniref:DNA internalization-related competence protein ComEC/Rec2 n=1 Tax=Candidatus Magnetaquicoccus inordinatus TaxID=2496818 RepID=UPI00102D0FEC|nr:DNA internalization-related competence protein ComEC/Rec2 [Candidatus Magnetaquicoccus inordinatus]
MLSSATTTDVPQTPLSGVAVALLWQIAAITLLSAQQSTEWTLITLAALAVALLASLLYHRQGNNQTAALLGLLLGACSMLLQYWPTPTLPAALINQPITLEAQISERQDRPDSLQLQLEQGVATLQNQAQAAPIPIPGIIQITLHPPEPLAALPGDRIALSTRLKPAHSAHNPGGFDYGHYLQQQGISCTGSSYQEVELLGTDKQWSWNRYRQQLSFWLAEQLPESKRGLLEALMVGKTGYIDETLNEELQVSGTYHLVAISGLQVGLVSAWSLFLLRRLAICILPLSERWDMKQPAALLAILPTIAYAYLAGWSVSTQRATGMMICYLLALAMGRSRQIWRILILSAIVILCWQPGQLFTAGFQLSYLSVVGLLFFMPFFERGNGWRKHLLLLLMSSVVASIVTTPLTAHYFHRFSPYSLLANLPAVPWVSFISTPLGLLAMLLHEIPGQAANQLLQWMNLSLEPYRLLLTWINSLPGAWQRLAGPPLAALLLWIALSAAAALLLQQRWRRTAGSLFILSWLLLAWPRSTPPAGQLHLAVLDVGQAQSVLLHTPNGGWSAMDVGGFLSPRFNPGEAFTSSYLWHRGANALQRVIISHPQLDHFAGAEQLLRNFPVQELWVGDFPQAEEENLLYRSLLVRAKELKVQVRHLHQPYHVTEGGVDIAVLPPLTGELARNDNDSSLVVEISYQKARFLVPGDATTRTEKWLLAQQQIRPLTLLLAPHHGSKSSSSPAFVQASQAQHVVFSAGRFNSYHHPHPQVVERWQKAAAQLWRTDQQGAIMIQSDGLQTQVTTLAQAEPLLRRWLTLFQGKEER